MPAQRSASLFRVAAHMRADDQTLPLPRLPHPGPGSLPIFFSICIYTFRTSKTWKSGTRFRKFRTDLMLCGEFRRIQGCTAGELRVDFRQEKDPFLGHATLVLFLILRAFHKEQHVCANALKPDFRVFAVRSGSSAFENLRTVPTCYSPAASREVSSSPHQHLPLEFHLDRQLMDPRC